MTKLGFVARNQRNYIKYYTVLGWQYKNAFSLGVFGPLSSKVNLHSLTINKNLKLITNEKINLADKKVERPLILLYSWTLAKDKNVMKYVKMHLDLGYDVLKIRTPIHHLLYPPIGTQVTASRILQFLHENPSFNPLVVHSFSVGVYDFGEILVKVQEESPKHNELIKKFKGQIWDSAVDVYGLPNAVSKAMADKKLPQKLIEKILELHMKLNYKVATVHYNKSSAKIHENEHNIPTIFLFSKGDPASPPDMNINVFTKWKNKKVYYYKCYENSTHCSHYVLYPDEYVKDVTSFLSSVGMTPSPVEGCQQDSDTAAMKDQNHETVHRALN